MSSTIYVGKYIDSGSEHIYLDESGYKNYTNADGLTCVLHTSHILKDAGWSIE